MLNQSKPTYQPGSQSPTYQKSIDPKVTAPTLGDLQKSTTTTKPSDTKSATTSAAKAALDATKKVTDKATETATQTVKDFTWSEVTGTGFKKEEEKNWEKYWKSRAGKYDSAQLMNHLSSKRTGNPKIRRALEAISVKSAIYGIGGMAATYIENTDPPLPGVPNGLGYQYINSVIRYGTFIAFQPGIITWKISDGIAEGIINAGNIVHVAQEVISGGMDFNKPKLLEYWKEVARHSRVAILLLGLEDLGLNTMYFGGTLKTNDWNLTTAHPHSAR